MKTLLNLDGLEVWSTLPCFVEQFNGLHNSSTVFRTVQRSFPHRNVPKLTIETTKYCAKAHFFACGAKGEKSSEKQDYINENAPEGREKNGTPKFNGFAQVQRFFQDFTKFNGFWFNGLLGLNFTLV